MVLAFLAPRAAPIPKLSEFTDIPIGNTVLISSAPRDLTSIKWIVSVKDITANTATTYELLAQNINNTITWTRAGIGDSIPHRINIVDTGIGGSIEVTIENLSLNIISVTIGRAFLIV